MLNNINLSGRMTRDPELRRTGTGKAVVNFTLAVDRGKEDQNGKSADFIPVVVWNRIAEVTEQYCGKGSLVAVSGSLRERIYANREGKNVHVLEVVAESVEFLSVRKASTSQGAANGNAGNGVPDMNYNFEDAHEGGF